MRDLFYSIFTNRLSFDVLFYRVLWIESKEDVFEMIELADEVDKSTKTMSSSAELK